MVVVAEVFLANWLYLGVVCQRHAERRSCSWTGLSEAVREHRGVYTVLGPLLAFLWQATLLTTLALLLLTYLDLRRWRGHDSATAALVLGSAVILVPAIVTAATCLATNLRTASFLPILIPENW
jgi:hypothetical protein